MGGSRGRTLSVASEVSGSQVVWKAASVGREPCCAALLPPCVHHVEVLRAIHMYMYARMYT